MTVIIQSSIFFVLAIATSALLIESLRENTRGFKFSDKFTNYFYFFVFAIAVLLTATQTVPLMLVDEFSQFQSSKITPLSFAGFLIGLFAGLAVINLTLTYISMLIVAGARAISNWINTL